MHSALLALLLNRRWPVAAFCILWTGITLAPVLNARWMAANVLTERYLYLPSVGFCWLAGWAAKSLWDHLNEQTRTQTALRVAILATGVALVLLGVGKTWARNRIWHDDMILYTTTLETDPDSYVMHMNLGVNYFGVNFKASESELCRALELRPDSPNVLNVPGLRVSRRKSSGGGEDRVSERDRYQAGVDRSPLQLRQIAEEDGRKGR